MSNNPKIMVFKLKELIYTGIFILLGILLIILFIFMFQSAKNEKPSASAGEVNALAENPITTFAAENETTLEASQTEQSTTSQQAAQADSSQQTAKTDSTQQTAQADSTQQTAQTDSTEQSKKDTKKSEQATSDKTYSPGVYTSSLMLNNSSLEIEVCVDVNRIQSISIKNMDEAITTMYPLMENSVNDLENQIVNSQSLENITYTDDCRYTYLILLDAVNQALSKATPNET